MQIATVLSSMESVILVFMLLGLTAARPEMISTSHSQIGDGRNFTVICHYQKVDLDSEVFSPTLLILARQTEGSSTLSQIAQYNQEGPDHQLQSHENIPAGRDWVVSPCNETLESQASDQCFQLTVRDAKCSDAGIYKCTGFYSNGTVSLEMTQTITISNTNCSASNSDKMTAPEEGKTQVRGKNDDDDTEDVIRGLKIGLIIAGFVIVALIVAVVALMYQIHHHKNASYRFRSQSVSPPPSVHVSPGLEAPSCIQHYDSGGDFDEVPYAQPRLSVVDSHYAVSPSSFHNYYMSNS